MESMDRLKKYVRANTDRTVLLTKYPEQYGVCCSTVINDLIDAVEREVEEGYVELPKDADGIPVHINDEMESEYSPDRVFIVKRLKYSEKNGWMIGGAIREDLSEYGLYDCRNCHHYKPPTTEDVLEKALNKAAMLDRKEGYWPSAADITNIINEFSPRLQLREED